MLWWPAVSRRLHLAVILAACTPPPSQPQPQPVAEPAPTPPPPAPVPEASPPPPPPAPSLPDEDPPAPPGARKWHLAAIREGALSLHAMADGAVAVRGDTTFAIAPPRTGPLRRERAWSRGLAFDEAERQAADIAAFGGRWPDAAFMTLRSDSGRVADLHSVLRWQDGAWMKDPLPSPADLIAYYAAYAALPDGKIAGLRSFTAAADDDPDDEDSEPKPKPPRIARPVLDLLSPASRPPWPALPSGPSASDLLALASGDLVVLRSGPQLHHWPAGAAAWKKLPPPGYTASNPHDTPVLAGHAVTDLWLATCPDLESDTPPRLHRYDGARWHRVPTPDSACVTSIAVTTDDTVWLTAGGALYRDDPGPPHHWTRVDLPTPTLGGRDAPAWRPGDYGSPWRESPAEQPSAQRLTPTHILAFGTDDLWLTATADPARFDDTTTRSVALTTRPLRAPLHLPDDDLADLEAHAQEPEVIPTSRETACADIVLDLGETTDTPATTRPASLTALITDETDLQRLSIVAVDLGARHGVHALWLADSPDPTDSFTLLAALAERLRPAHPRVRLLCRHPVIVRVLP